MKKVMPSINSSDTNSMVLILDQVILFSLCAFAAFCMFSISITQISFAIGVLAWLFKTHLTKSWKELRGTGVGFAILCFLLAGILSITSSVDLKSSAGILKKLIQFVIFFWIINTLNDRKKIHLVVSIITIAGVIAALNGLYPQIEAYKLNPIFYPRSKGTMSVPSSFAAILMIASAFLLSKLLFHNSRRYLSFLALLIVYVAILYSQTRQAWLGTGIASMYILFLWNKKYVLPIPLLCLLFMLYGLPAFKNTPGFKERLLSFTSFQDPALQQRISSWKVGFKIFKDHPVTGCGYKCVDAILPQYPDPSGKTKRFRGMHNNIIQLLIDTGVVGLISWISIWITYYIEVFKRLSKKDEEKTLNNFRFLLVGASGAVLAFLVGGCFESSLYDSEVNMLIIFLVGLSLVCGEKTLKTS